MNLALAAGFFVHMTIEGKILSQAGVFQRSGQNVSKIDCPTGHQRTFSLEGRRIVLTDKGKASVRIVTNDQGIKHEGVYVEGAKAVGVHSQEVQGKLTLISEITLSENSSVQVSFRGRQEYLVAEFNHKL